MNCRIHYRHFPDISNPSFSPSHFSSPLRTQVPLSPPFFFSTEPGSRVYCFLSFQQHTGPKEHASPNFPISLPLTLPLHLLLYDFPKQKPIPALTCVFQLLAPFSKHTSSKNPSLSLFFSQVSINNQTLHTLKK